MNKSIQKQDKRARRQKRIRAKISGTAKRPRLSVFRSNRGLYAQVIDDSVGKTIASADTKEVKKGTLMDKAVELGKLIAKKAAEKKITSVVFDRAGFVYAGKIKAVADGARMGGLKF